MNVITYEMNFEWQMGQAMKDLLRRCERTLDSFDTPEDFRAFLWNERKEFGKIVVERMGEWADDEDWMETVEQARRRNSSASV